MTEIALQQLLAQVTEAIVTGYQPDEIVLFGSAARGDYAEGSDLDLLIVKDTDKKPMQRVREVIDCLPHTIDVDLIVLTPSEKMARERESHYLLHEISQQGKILYSRLGHESSGGQLA